MELFFLNTKKVFQFGVVLSFLVVFPVYGDHNLKENCRDFRLDREGAAMAQIPVWNQENERICFAYSASDLIDAYRFSHPSPMGDQKQSHLTSAFILGLETALRLRNDTKVSLKSTEKKVEALKASYEKKKLLYQQHSDKLEKIKSQLEKTESNLGSEKKLEKEKEKEELTIDLERLKTLYQSDEKLIALNNKLLDLYRNQLKAEFLKGSRVIQALRTAQDFGSCNSDLVKKNKAEIDLQISLEVCGIKCEQAISKALNDPAFKAYEAITEEAKNAHCILGKRGISEKILPTRSELFKVFMQFKDEEVVDLIFKQLTNSCKGEDRIQLRIPRPVELNISSATDLAKLADEMLNPSKPPEEWQPFSVSYCGEVLRRGASFDGLNRTRQSDKKSGQSKCEDSDGDHSNHASTIIGRRYNETSGKCQLLIKNTWGKKCSDYSSDWECDKGKIWVDMDALGNNVFNATFFEK
jgi:hypothetical protein